MYAIQSLITTIISTKGLYLIRLEYFPVTILAKLCMQISDQHPYNYESDYKNSCLYYNLTIKSRIVVQIHGYNKDKAVRRICGKNTLLPIQPKTTEAFHRGLVLDVLLWYFDMVENFKSKTTTNPCVLHADFAKDWLRYLLCTLQRVKSMLNICCTSPAEWTCGIFFSVLHEEFFTSEPYCKNL